MEFATKIFIQIPPTTPVLRYLDRNKQHFKECGRSFFLKKKMGIFRTTLSESSNDITHEKLIGLHLTNEGLKKRSYQRNL